jgi:hypothetical protein
MGQPLRRGLLATEFAPYDGYPGLWLDRESRNLINLVTVGHVVLPWVRRMASAP